MEDNIRSYVEELFAGTPPTKKAVELKEEMIQNLTEKYSDLLGDGKTPEAAYNIVIAGIGDVSGLLRDLEKEPGVSAALDAGRQRSAMFTAIAVMLYIVSVVPLIFISMTTNSDLGTTIGIALMFFFIAVATGLLIYNGMTKPRYLKANDTMVEDFRQWQSDTHETKSLRRSINAAIWSLTIAVYFIVSFLTGWWHFSWVIFILATAINSIINIGFTIRKK